VVVVPDRSPGRVPVRHYYHAYVDGNPVKLRRILAQHFAALRESGVGFAVTVGMVGKPRNRERFQALLPADVTAVHGWDTGFEQRTLSVLQNDLGSFEGPVLYAHTKGAGFPVPVSDRWRQCMTRRVVAEARIPLKHLADGADTVGCHWLTRDEFPAHPIEIPFYGGNFWWSTTDHLRRLPPIDGGNVNRSDRFLAEAWLGSVVPDNPVSLVGGWPGSTCHQH
jgi:hypothetical protein